MAKSNSSPRKAETRVISRPVLMRLDDEILKAKNELLHAKEQQNWELTNWYEGYATALEWIRGQIRGRKAA